MRIKHFLTTIFFFLVFIFSPISNIFASSPSFSFYPQSGVVKKVDEGFIVDVLIDSGDNSLTKAMFTFNFDPRVLQLRKASRNNTLFEQWPEDESSLDNDNGIVMLTGFTQSGSSTLYKTEGEPDLFARLEFDVISSQKDQVIDLEWEYSGSDQLFQTVLVADGSPPQNVLMERPSDARFRIGQVPQTAIESRHIPFIVGGFLILLAGLVITSRPDALRKKYGTVVMYEND
jgi:hypothetical protein